MTKLCWKLVIMIRCWSSWFVIFQITSSDKRSDFERIENWIRKTRVSSTVQGSNQKSVVC